MFEFVISPSPSSRREKHISLPSAVTVVTVHTQRTVDKITHDAAVKYRASKSRRSWFGWRLAG